jgi:ankyrin repeat protein
MTRFVEKFIKHGANIDQTFPFSSPASNQVQKDTSPLSVAVQLRHVEVVKILLQNKADTTIKDGNGKSAAAHARASEKAEMAQLFAE